MKIITLSTEERLLERREIRDGHWIWTGAKNSTGYGYIKINGEDKRVHRVAYEVFVGPIPEGQDVLHKRECIGHPDCFNPEHLYVGTVQMNADDRVACGRQHDRRGELCPTHILNEEQVNQIRAMRWTHTARQITELFPIKNPTYVWQIWLGYVWGHLPGCPERPLHRPNLRQSSDAERFMLKVSHIGDCWVWRGARTFRLSAGGAQMALRAGYEIFVESPPDGFRIISTCSTPNCVNPDHAKVATQSEICQIAERSRVRRKGESVNTSKLKPEDIPEIFRRFINGESRAEIARHFGISGQHSIDKILRRQSWQHIPIPENLLTQAGALL